MFAEEIGNVCNQRNILNGRIPDKCIDVGLIRTSSMTAAIHLGPNFKSNSEIYKITKFEDIETVFNITQKLVREHSEEILNAKCLEHSSPSWARSVFANNQAMAKAKECLCADLCVGQMKDTPGATERWKGLVEGLKLYSFYQDAVGTDGEPIEFEWNIFTGFSFLSILQRTQEDLETRRSQPEEFTDQIIFMSMFNDTVMERK